MKLKKGDKVVLAGIKSTVALVNAYGYAYLAPDADGGFYNRSHLLMGLVFAILDEKGYDKLGNRAKKVAAKKVRVRD